MLKNLDPLLSPDLLQVLRAMGHGDEIALVDGNYPADAHAQRLIRLDGIPVTAALDAVLSVMPLDLPEFMPEAAFHMQVVGNPKAEMPIFQEFRDLIAKHESPAYKLGSIERFAFYERVKNAYAVVATGEARLYGNIILVKGVIKPK